MAKSWNSKLGWFNDNYILNVLSATFGPSAKGSPMITFQFEVMSPQTVTINGEEITVAGAKITHRAVTQSKTANGEVDVIKTEKMAQRLEALYKAFGLDFSAFNAENADTSGFEGKKVWAFVDHEIVEQRKSPTAEQIANKQLGDIAVNPVTGDKLQNFYPGIKEFFGLAQV